MLLNYLYSHFLEESAFAETCGIPLHDLLSLMNRRIFPAPSYIYESNSRSVSFVSDFDEDATYRFHLRGHEAWFDAIRLFGFEKEERARRYFFSRYETAKQTFLTSELGRKLAEIVPDVPEQFNSSHADMTWENFLKGVYGVCTRDGQPESVFLKQAGVMFIEELTSTGPGSLATPELRLLAQAVTLLDRVESEFAPHEALHASRQRCIVDVQSKFLDKAAA
ncbi:DUF6058 family natural product biosynthesis protein [Nisaea sp.]|uniref:DUF6058 family natural product biosynthesis protein n=1 Tax=Nisaea sp. TaxID=2024842 RepID=UPI0032673744